MRLPDGQWPDGYDGIDRRAGKNCAFATTAGTVRSTMTAIMHREAKIAPFPRFAHYDIAKLKSVLTSSNFSRKSLKPQVWDTGYATEVYTK